MLQRIRIQQGFCFFVGIYTIPKSLPTPSPPAPPPPRQVCVTYTFSYVIVLIENVFNSSCFYCFRFWNDPEIVLIFPRFLVLAVICIFFSMIQIFFPFKVGVVVRITNQSWHEDLYLPGTARYNAITSSIINNVSRFWDYNWDCNLAYYCDSDYDSYSYNNNNKLY